MNRSSDGLWAAGLLRRAQDGSAEPLCLDCRDEGEPVERSAASELMLLWRRGKSFRRHRLYR
jgi:hypothetical protein